MERLLDRIADAAWPRARRGPPPQSHAAERCLIVTKMAARRLPMTYDSGDYPECQRRALAAAGWTIFPPAARPRARDGRLIGIGLSNYVEGTGRGPFESASVRIGASGKIVVTTGATAQGQGTQTMLAQIAADALGVRPDDDPRHRRRHRGEPARPRRLCEPAGRHRRQCGPSRGARRRRKGQAGRGRHA